MRIATYVDAPAIAVFALLNFYLWGIWYIESDDAAYILAAREWNDQFPYVSNFWWGLRHPTVLPISLSLQLFGDNEISVAVPTIIYSLGIVLVTYFLVKSFTDRLTGILASVIVAASPALTELSTTPNVDPCELFFVATSLLTFFYASLRNANAILFVIAGIAAGLAFVSRESTVA